MSSASFSDTLSHLFTAMTQAQPALATCSDSRKSYKTMQRAVQYSENYSAEETECVYGCDGNAPAAALSSKQP